jgi:MFS family permease
LRQFLPQIAPQLRFGLRWPDGLRALRSRNFRLFFFGQLISLIGVWMQSTAQQWLVYRLTGSQLKLGAVTFAGYLPVLLLSLFMGVIVDRFSNRTLLVWTQSAFMILAAILALITFLDVVKYEHIILLAFLMGIANAMDMPARQAIYTDLVERKDLLNAIALNSSVFNGARIIGPAIGGFIVAQLGEAVAFGVNSITYLAVIFGLLLMKIEIAPQSKSENKGTQDLLDGLRYLFREKSVLGLVVMVAALSVMGFSYLTLLPVFAQDVLQIGAEGFGGLLAAQGAGALIAALSLAFQGDRLPKGKLLTYSRYLLAFAIFLLGFSRFVTLTVIALILAGFALISQLALTNTLLQLIVPDEFRGRVLSSYTWALGGFFPIGSLLIGSMGDAFGAPNAVMISAGFSLIFTIIGGVYFRDIRDLD